MLMPFFPEKGKTASTFIMGVLGRFRELRELGVLG